MLVQLTFFYSFFFVAVATTEMKMNLVSVVPENKFSGYGNQYIFVMDHVAKTFQEIANLHFNLV